jgi:hypothetical protein
MGEGSMKTKILADWKLMSRVGIANPQNAIRVFMQLPSTTMRMTHEKSNLLFHAIAINYYEDQVVKSTFAQDQNIWFYFQQIGWWRLQDIEGMHCKLDYEL